MQLLATATQWVMVPVTGPTADLTGYQAYMAIIPDGENEPSTSDYKSAVWMNGEVALKVSAGDFPEGQYKVYVRVTTGDEDVRLWSGRLRIGDARA